VKGRDGSDGQKRRGYRLAPRKLEKTSKRVSQKKRKNQIGKSFLYTGEVRGREKGDISLVLGEER